MIRWSLRIFIALAILLALLALVVQGVLMTDLPRRRVLEALERETGLRVQAAKLNTGWTGKTALTDLRISLPLSEDPLLTAAAMRISHAGLINLAIFRDLDLQTVEIEHPTLTLREGDRGEWNVVRAIDLIRRRQEQSEPGGDPPSLPEVRVERGTIRVVRGGEVVMSTPLTFAGEPVGTTTWAFEAHLGPNQWAKGRLSPGGDWEHEVEFQGERIEALLAPFIDGDSSAVPPSSEHEEHLNSRPTPGASRTDHDLPSASAAASATFGVPLHGPTVMAAITVPTGVQPDDAGQPGNTPPPTDHSPSHQSRESADSPPSRKEPVSQEQPPTSARGRWRGRLTPGGVTGRLELDDLEVGETRAAGEADVVYYEGDIRIDAQNLDIQTPLVPQGPVRLVRGGIRREGDLYTIDGAAVELLDVEMEADGAWDAARRRGEFSAIWAGALPGVDVQYDGQIEARISTPNGRPRVEAQIVTAGASPAGRWEAQIEARARGANWRRLDVTAHAPMLYWMDEIGVIDLAGARIAADVQDELIRLVSLTLPGDGAATAAATFNRDTKAWSLDFSATQWRIPRADLDPADLAVRAHGDARQATIEEANIDVGPISAAASGTYVLDRPVPLQALATLRHAHAEAPEDSVPGDWAARLEVSGDLRPANIVISGEVEGQDIGVATKSIDRVLIPLGGRITDDLVTLETGRFDLLGGTWRLDAKLTTADRLLAATVESDSVPIQSLLELFGAPLEMPGELATTLEVRIPELDPDRVEVGGSWEIGPTGYAQFAADAARGRLSTREGVLRLQDVVVARGPGQLSGALEFNVRERRHLLLDITATDWPVKIEGTSTAAVLDGRARLNADVIDLSAQGDIQAAADLIVGDRHVGTLAVEGDVRGRTLNATRIAGDLPSGTIRGSGVFPLDDWPRSKAELALQDVHLDELAVWAGVSEPITGIVSGVVRASPAEDPKAPEPLQIEVALETLGGSFRALAFGNARLTAFAGPKRFLLDRSTFQLASGEADLWLRLTRHGTEPFIHMVADLRGLELNEFVQSVTPGAEPILGLLSGRIALGGYLQHPHRAFGQGQIALVQSDLANLPFIALIYDLLNLGLAGRGPTGRGVLDFRLEADTLHLTRLQYFNRGADIVADLTIRNIWLGAQSPIQGLAAGAVRPLRDIDLPLFGDLDRLVGALQANAVSVRIGGTLGNAETSTVPFEEIGGTVVRILGLSPRDN